jgi:glycosyltransferase involved in cell wall biosynthesis
VTAPEATVLIPTRNRRDELRGAIASAVAQTAHVEVLVLDDGSTDGTAEMVAREFPTVRLHRSETAREVVVQRNLGARLARAPVVVSIDDDGFFRSRRTVEQTLAEFDHPRVGAVAIPLVDVRPGAPSRERAPERAQTGAPARAVARFLEGSVALRRDVFLALGGYREGLLRQGEEADLSLRLLEAGYVIRLGSADPVHHRASATRDLARMDVYGSRNAILSCWHNEPHPFMAVRMLEQTGKGLVLGVRLGRPHRKAHGLALGFADCWRRRRERSPVSRRTARVHRLLRRHGSLALEELDVLLEPAR